MSRDHHNITNPPITDSLIHQSPLTAHLQFFTVINDSPKSSSSPDTDSKSSSVLHSSPSVLHRHRQFVTITTSPTHPSPIHQSPLPFNSSPSLPIHQNHHHHRTPIPNLRQSSSSSPDTESRFVISDKATLLENEQI